MFAIYLMNNRLKHIAFIMDGNGRWASLRNKTRAYGHRAGTKNLKLVIEECDKIGLEVVTFYAFSTENWKRPKEEIDKLFSYIKKFSDEELNKYSKRNFRTSFIGDLTALPIDVQESLLKVKEGTKNNTGMIINIALNYGSRIEILKAVNELLASSTTNVSEEEFVSHLYTASLPDPDIIVRTSGEKRLSNFLLYQSAYTEFIFVDEYWPDFNKQSFHNVIEEYNRRTRRFGSI